MTVCVNTVTSSIKAKMNAYLAHVTGGENKLQLNRSICKRTACIGFYSHKAKVDRNQIFWEISLSRSLFTIVNGSFRNKLGPFRNKLMFQEQLDW